MTTIAIPAYHFGILKGYLLGQNAPAEILLAADALHMAAVQGPLREDALVAIRLVTEAAEKLLARVETIPSASKPAMAGDQVENTEMGPPDIDLPAIIKRASERARSAAEERGGEPAEVSDEDKVEAFLKTRSPTFCPPAHAASNKNGLVVDESEPKKRKEWSQEARAAAAERMRARQAAGLMKRGKAKEDLDGYDQGEDSGDSERPEPSVGRGRHDDSGNGEAPVQAGAGDNHRSNKRIRNRPEDGCNQAVLDRDKVEAFVERRGVTVLPPSQSGETGAYHATANGRNDAPADERPPAALNGEMRLARAKLLTMFEDLAGRPKGSQPGEKESLRQQAYRWFFREGDFEDWCDSAGYKAEWMRKRAREIWENGMDWSNWRAAPGQGKSFEKRRAYRENAKLRRQSLKSDGRED